ncbi:hypothetical protein E2986_10931 [Frieseomelitta varia]|uniref:RWD domain-containing protein n=1 Tax=Frieseomelitta varia TaxID=561572 RepID=A0A833RS97_9HYME|nr:hypothetical protein E2986_10931 [Frieseomelitta varia]
MYDSSSFFRIKSKLHSIFGEEIRDLRPEKRKWQPLNLIISLMPQKSMSLTEAYAQIDLHVICADKYPDEVPNIQLENSKGLSHQQVAVLHNDLVQLAKQLQGEVMIFDLAHHVQIYLHEHNKPSYSSFYEEMVSRRQKKIEIEKLEKQLKEDKERQVIVKVQCLTVQCLKSLNTNYKLCEFVNINELLPIKDV